MRAQGLIPDAARSATGVAALTGHLLGIQAQELPAATLAIRPRSHGLRAEDVRHAREDAHAVVLTWVMRGTLHLVAAADLGWLLGFFSPLNLAHAQRRFKQLGLDASIRGRATRILRDTLHERGPLTRPALAAILAAQGIPVAGQAIAYLVHGAALEGAICCGPERGPKLTYVALDDWLTLGPSRDPVVVPAELARRYLASYAPAGPEDLAKWAGIGISQARAGFEALARDLIAVETEEGPAWLPATHADWLDGVPEGPLVRLLPGYDPYLLGYRSRAFMSSAEAEAAIHPGGGLIRPTLIVDGEAAGTWKLGFRKGGATLTVMPLNALDAAVQAGLEAEVQDVGRFLDAEVSLVVEA